MLVFKTGRYVLSNAGLICYVGKISSKVTLQEKIVVQWKETLQLLFSSSASLMFSIMEGMLVVVLCITTY